MDPHALVGSWHLVRWEVTYGDGRPATLPFGPEATGLIVYGPDGWMNASMSQPRQTSLQIIWHGLSALQGGWVAGDTSRHWSTYI